MSSPSSGPIDLKEAAQSSDQTPQNEGRTADKDSEPQPVKIWDLDDPFEHAPVKPDGDHWEILLKPLLKSNKAQCDIWKDEVQNLLIFAGLFSAVVTAFIIESYKGLQRDPENDMVNLLMDIAVQLRTASNTTSVIPPQSASLLSPFAPDPSTIRINIFWFTSLILSLTTVLVGIISLQWLREHQNYAGLTPMQQYAIFHMRKEGLEKWHVGTVFTAMPLLLQFALVLFSTGIIDFLQAFGHITVVIPVAIVIGLTFLFLVATTLLPTLQICALFFKFSPGGKDSKPPVQCPYKSPQSNVFRAMSFPIFHLLRLSYPFLSTKYRRLQLLFRRSEGLSYSKLGDYTYSQHICCSERTWLTFDLNWLAIRDGFMRRAFHRPLDDEDRLGQDADQESVHLPVWDILRGLISQIAPISPVYHAFSELSDKTLSIYSNHRDYFNDVVSMDFHRPDVHFSDFYEHFFKRSDSKLLHKYQVLFTFLYRTPSQDQTAVTLHMTELQLRLILHLYTSHCPVHDDKKQGSIPFCLRPNGKVSEASLPLQVAQATTALFEAMGGHSVPDALINVPCGRDDLGRYMLYFADALILQTDDPAVLQALCSIFDLINEKLEQEISTLDIPSSGARASLLFYSATMFVRQSDYALFFEKELAEQLPSFNTLFSTMVRYKRLTIDKGLSDTEIEDRLGFGWCYQDIWPWLEANAPSSGPTNNKNIPDGDSSRSSASNSSKTNLRLPECKPESVVEHDSTEAPLVLASLPTFILPQQRPYDASDNGQTGIPSNLGPIIDSLQTPSDNPSHKTPIKVPLTSISARGSVEIAIDNPQQLITRPPTDSQSNAHDGISVNPQSAVIEIDPSMESHLPLGSTSEHDRPYDIPKTGTPETASNVYPIPGATSLSSDNLSHGEDFNIEMLPEATVEYDRTHLLFTRERDTTPSTPSNPGGSSITINRSSPDNGGVNMDTLSAARSN